MKRRYLTYLFLWLAAAACEPSVSDDCSKTVRDEIGRVEAAFNKMVLDSGLSKAFTFYAAEDGVINRDGKIIQGKKAIKAWYEQKSTLPGSLFWKPAFIDVSNSGELAYSYGNYTWVGMDSLGREQRTTGIFHTVWKKQSNGTWRFVWD